MIDECGLYIKKEMNTFCATKDTEFKNKYEDIEYGAREILQKRKDGNIYQFIWELKKK